MATIVTTGAGAVPRQTTRIDGSEAPVSRGGEKPTEALAPAVRITIGAASSSTSERIVVYGRAGTLQGAGHSLTTDETPDSAEANPADVLDRKLAEGRKELAAIQIKQLKVATRDAGVLALLDPRAAITYAKHAANALSGAARAFGEGEATIAEVEDRTLAEAAPDAVTAIAHDVVTQTVALDLAATGQAEGYDAIDAAIRQLVNADAWTGEAAESGRTAATGDQDATLLLRLEGTTRIEATTIVTVRGESAPASLEASIGAERSDRLGEDAEVIKDAISTLRHLARLIAASTKRLQEAGGLDLRTAGELSEAQNAFSDAIADTTRAALPVVRAGHSILPDDGE
ncbi:hypothetical protein [uncultured Methylobacterium sp.]|uniref:hypothetical protein n=1 Tax=uncultured Methylobacterium sp. TaxID=157278 RepID=UPI0035CAB8FE